MATTLIHGCSYSKIWVHPKNWKTLNSKKALSKNWYVECKYYDPLFKEKYPKGFPYRKKLNRLKTLQERKEAIRLYLSEIPILFETKGYNPITKQYMIDPPTLEPLELNPDLLFIEAFRRALNKLRVSKTHKTEINYAINRVEKAAMQLRLNEIKIKDLKRSELKKILDYINLPDNYFNKFKTCLSSLFVELIEYECCETNITRDIRKRKIIKKKREVLDTDSYKQVMKYLQINNYTFYRYAMIFLYSGARTSELLRLKRSEVSIEKREFKITIEKGAYHKQVTKVIFDGALEYWQEIVKETKNDDDYLFSVGLKPGKSKIDKKQVTRRWKTHIKDKLNITADFYALKHYFLDRFDTETAMQIASHTNSKTTTIYQTTKDRQKIETLKKMHIVV